MITAWITYCLVMNPYICRAFQLEPIDRKIISISDCMRGGMMGAAEFTFDGARWFVKGVRCREERDDEVATWLRDHRP